MKHLPLIFAIAASLSGCDQAQEFGEKLHKQYRDEMGPKTFAFVPGFKMVVDGQTFPIYGTEICPEAVTAKVFIIGGGYNYPGQGTFTCLVVHPNSERVIVQRGTPHGLINEIWRVEHDGDESLRLWTQAGKPVVAAKR